MNTGKTEGNNLLLYIDGEPIGCTTSATFEIPENDSPILCPAVPEWNITVSGKWLELTRLEALKFEWYCARRMPRKKKKAYRKQLEKAIAYEVYRERILEFLTRVHGFISNTKVTGEPPQ